MSRFIGTAKVFDVGSFTDELKVYRVTIMDNGLEGACDCPARVYNPMTECKHIRAVLADIADDGIPELLQGQERVDIVDIMADSFHDGFMSGMDVARKALERGLLK
jgi:uncharacterized Zn finger protein